MQCAWLLIGYDPTATHAEGSGNGCDQDYIGYGPTATYAEGSGYGCDQDYIMAIPRCYPA